MKLVPFDGQLDDDNTSPKGLVPFDGELDQEAGWGTAIKSSLAGAINAADAAISLPAGALANYLGFQEQGDAVFKAMEERAKQNQQWANPENAPLSTAQQIGGTLITAPAQVLGMFGAPAMKGTDLIQRGEDLSTAIPATAIETGMNVAGVGPMQAAKSVLGRAAIGAGSNMAFGAGADAATQLLAKQEATKQAYDPYDLDRRLVEGVTGGVLQAAFGERPTTPRSGSSKVNSILEQDAAAKGKQPEPTASGEPGQLPMFDDFEMRSPISPYQTEMAPNMWRVDENGIPIRADLSMEVQNLQQPLQRNLFGDELDANFPRDPNKPLSMDTGDIAGVERFSDPVSFRNDPENQRPLTEAIDLMPEGIRNRVDGKFAPGTTRQSALDLLRREIPASPELEVARMDAETANWLEANKRPETQKPRNLAKGRGRSQRGGVWFGDLDKSEKLQDLADSLAYRFPALEKLPNKETFTWEQLQQSINRQEVPEPERKLLTLAYDIASSVPEVRDPNNPWKGTKANAKEFVDALAQVAADFSLEKRRSATYADYGLEAIGRQRPEDGVPGVKPNTNIWRSPYIPLSEGIRGHFTDENYFGHTRNFVENGQKYVVEIQSDLVQKYKKAGHSQLKDNTVAEIRDMYDRAKEQYEAVRGLFEGEEAKYREFLSKNPDFAAWMEGRDPTNAEAKLYNTQVALSRELVLRENAKITEPMSKNWFVRLIREELADSAKKGETSVRFATADTMAKVEGWPKNIDQDLLNDRFTLRKEYDYSKASLEALGIDPKPDWFLDLEQRLRKTEDAINNAKFDPQVQSIYDRYQKDVTKYLMSIGGQLITDTKGETWIEVPVERSRQRPIMFGQRGALLIDWNTPKIDNSEVTLDGSLIPKNPVVEDAISAALKQGKDGKQWNYMQSGSTSVAMKTGSPIVKAASEIVQNAVKRADLAIRNYIFPTEAAFRKLSKVELTDLAEIMKAEMLKGERIDGDVLARNLSIKQLEAYTRMRDMFDKTLDAQNAVRVAQGKKPISAHEAYMSSRWQGDFRQPVYDAEGNLVWYLAANTKKGLELQAEKLKKVSPGVVIDPAKAHVVKSSHMGTDLQSAYTTMLDILDPQRDKAAIQELKAAIEDQLVAEGELTLAQEKHFKRKSGVRGYAGDRPWMDASKDALDMFQQQIQYAKNAFKWSEMQQVSKDIGAIVSNEQLQQQQPNNIKYIREYYKNAIGMGEAQVTRALNDAMRDGLGVSPNLVSQAVGNMKSFFITQKLAVSVGYTLSNLIQAGNVLPYLSDLAGQGIRGNPLTSIPTGVLGGMAMAVSHYMKSLGSEYINQLPNQFFKDAFRYAEENGVTARSVYDEAPLDTGFSPSKKVLRVAGQTMAVPETFVRSVAFMTYAQWLKESGKFTDQMKLFQKAEELVNMSMVDYRETERPLMFAKAGAAGNFLNTLQTYPMSFYNQWSYMLKQASKGNLAGLGAMLAFQFAVAGAMGLPGFEDMDKLYKWIRDNAVSTETWNKMMKSPVFSDPKMWMIDTFGQSSVYGYLSDKTGIGLTSRVAAPGAGAMLQSPVGPIVDIAKQVGAVGSAVADPTNKQKVAEAALKVAPVGLQGFLETQPFMEDITFNERPDGTRTYMKNSDLSDRRGGYTRTPDEDAVRAWGIRSQKEVLTRDVAYATNSANQALTKKASELIDQYYNAVRLGNTEKAKKLATLYMDISGKEITDVQFENQIKEEFYNDVEKANTKGMTPRQLMNAAKMNKLLESK